MHALRVLLRRPAYALAVMLTLAVGVGLTTAMFSIGRAVLLRPLAYPESERLLFVSSSFPGASGGGDQLSLADIREIAARATTIDAIAPYHTGRALRMRGDGRTEPERVRANIVGPEYLEVLGARAVRGRLLGREDDRVPDGHPVVVVTHRFWERRLGGDQNVVGQAIALNDVMLTVVGVLSPDFRDVSAEEGYSFESDVFVPVMMLPSFGSAPLLTSRESRNFWALARVRPGASVAAAADEIRAIGETLQREFASNRGFTFWGERLDRYLARDITSPILLLTAGSILVLLIGCANVLNLLLTHLSARERELAVRAALGAGRARLVRLLLAESAILAVAGGAAGVVVAAFAARAFRLLMPGELTPRLDAVAIDAPAIAFAVVVSLAIAAVLATAASFRVARRGASAVLGPARGLVSHGGARLRRLLLVAEVAVSVMLVVGAVLMIESLRRLRSSDLGFATDRLITLEVEFPRAPARGATDDRDITEALRAIPGVEASMLWGPGRPGRNTWVTFPGREDAPTGGERLMTWRHTITPGALRDLGIPVRAGRHFSNADTSSTPLVAIVSETLARTLWPGEDAIGKRMRWRTDVADAPLLTVVGVAADAKHRGRLNAMLYPARDVYVPLAQRPDRQAVIVVRSASDPATVAAAVREVVRRAHPDVPVFNLRTMKEHLREEEGETRFAAVLMGAYAAIAVLLAAIGIYGVLSYHVALRRPEMALRLALGAMPRSVLMLVVGDGLRPAMVGIGAGLAGAAAAAQLIASMLFEMRPLEPAIYAAVAILLGLVALAAAAVPARYAMRTDAITVLRE